MYKISKIVIMASAEKYAVKKFCCDMFASLYDTPKDFFRL